MDKPMVAPYYGMLEEIHVMLVDHYKDFVTEMIDLLMTHDYKVTTVGTTLEAMSILSKGERKIDVIIINIHSPDLLSFQLLDQAMALDIISFFVCDEQNEFLAKKALNYGAYLYLRKPLEEEIVKCLWQFVLREKTRKGRTRKRSEERKNHMDVDYIGNNNIVGDNEEQVGEKNNVSSNTEDENDISSEGKYKPRKKRDRKITKEINEGENQNNTINKIVMRKNCIEWTGYLHAKFMEAAQQLGEGRCYPKDIVEMMNVSGLTRIQVASHLQRCRNNNWRAPKERKSTRHSSSQASSSRSQQKNSLRKFGRMPRLQTNIPNLQHNPNQIQRDSEFLCSAFNINNNFAREENSIQQQLNRPQLQNLEPPSVDLPSELGNSDFNQVYFDNQNLEPPSVNLRSEHGNSEFNQVYSDNQVSGTPSFSFQE